MVERQQQHGARPTLGPDDGVVDATLAARLLPRREFGAHKWGVGGLLIVAGAPGFVGAPSLCAMAAGRAGAGIVNLAVPRGIITAIAAHVPEAAFVLLPDSESAGGARRAVDLLSQRLEKSRALVVGPGLGDDEAAHALMSALLGFGIGSRAIGFGAGGLGFRSGNASPAAPQPEEQALVAAGKPMVIDADGLNWLAKQERWWERLPTGQAVLTPHVGELSRLLACAPAEIISDPIGTVRAAAETWGQTVVLKYGYTAVSDGRRVLVADDAPTSLATAGSGDVFAGMVGAFLAQGLTPMDAAALAIYVGSRAARRVERRTGTLGLVAGDLPLAIAEELAELEAGEAGKEGGRA